MFRPLLTIISRVHFKAINEHTFKDRPYMPFTAHIGTIDYIKQNKTKQNPFTQYWHVIIQSKLSIINTRTVIWKNKTEHCKTKTIVTAANSEQYTEL